MYSVRGPSTGCKMTLVYSAWGNPGEINPILPYKWLFWWVFNFRFLREDVKYAKNEVHELLFHVQIVTQVIYFLPLKKK